MITHKKNKEKPVYYSFFTFLTCKHRGFQLFNKLIYTLLWVQPVEARMNGKGQDPRSYWGTPILLQKLKSKSSSHLTKGQLRYLKFYWEACEQPQLDEVEQFNTPLPSCFQCLSTRTHALNRFLFRKKND